MLRDEDYRINITGTQPPPPTDADNDDQSLRYYITMVQLITTHRPSMIVSTSFSK